MNILSAISFNSSATSNDDTLRPVPTAAGATVPNFPATRETLFLLERAEVQPLLVAYNIAAAGGGTATSRLNRDIRAIAAHIGLR